jgi:hypothetical protein
VVVLVRFISATDAGFRTTVAVNVNERHCASECEVEAAGVRDRSSYGGCVLWKRGWRKW